MKDGGTRPFIISVIQPVKRFVQFAGIFTVVIVAIQPMIAGRPPGGLTRKFSGERFSTMEATLKQHKENLLYDLYHIKAFLDCHQGELNDVGCQINENSLISAKAMLGELIANVEASKHGLVA
jgi:hypothetical protein